MSNKADYVTPEMKFWEFEKVSMNDSTGFGGIDDGGEDEFD